MEAKTLFETAPTQVPIMKYFDDANAQGKAAIGKWRKNEAPLGILVALVGLGLIGWGLVKYVIPFVFTALAPVFTAIATVALVGFSIMMAPAIYSLFRKITREFHKATIRWKPFDELDEQKDKMWQAHSQYLSQKATVKKLRNDFEQMSNQTQKTADDAKVEIGRQTKKAGELKAQLDNLVASKGEGIKETDEYVDIQTKFINATSAGTRNSTTMDKNIEWTQKYAARSNIFANLDRKLAIGATLLENKIYDFEESIMIMKKDWEMSSASRGATTILKEILGPGGQNWKLEYALEFVSDKISEDLAVTAQNLEDLDRNTTAFNFDSDDAYDKLMAISNKN